jgi:hypothetical protein
LGGAKIDFLFHDEGEQDECADANKTRDRGFLVEKIGACLDALAESVLLVMLVRFVVSFGEGVPYSIVNLRADVVANGRHRVVLIVVV